MSKNEQMDSPAQREDVCRPMTGAEYLESLRDQREVWIYGERVKDVTLHPAFRNQARMVARMYDALHHPQTKAQLTCPTDTSSAGYTHRFFKASHNVEEMVAARDAIAAWERIGFGWMGRSPGFMGAFTGMLGPVRMLSFLPPIKPMPAVGIQKPKRKFYSSTMPSPRRR